MIDGYLKVVESFLAIYGVLAVFSLGVLEEIIFFIPMSLLFVAAGFFIIKPSLSFFPALGEALIRVSLPGTIGVLVGGVVIYGVVYWGGKRLVRRFGAHFGLQWEDIVRLNAYFSERYTDEAGLVALRAIPIFPIGIVSIFCGLIRFGLWEFIWTTFVGTLLRMAGLALLGWYLGREYLKYTIIIAHYERYVALVFLGGMVIALIVVYWRRRRLR